jgi:hypothetical protein
VDIKLKPWISNNATIIRSINLEANGLKHSLNRGHRFPPKDVPSPLLRSKLHGLGFAL